jgi:lipopolysaccharide transport system ATP-binding protein
MRGKPDPNAKISFIHQNRLEKGDEFWALRNIDLEIEEGEIVGIIGRNGAGKSTLLKILSQITAPTEGKIHVNGRMASLLEVGTGFHPELTGRENVYLNGAILGMSRKEVSKKFDEIVDFSEVEEFIDTPVKRYSSGMYVRLAFSVAAHLEPDILIVDEVLAVGDAEFQKKCIGKLQDASFSGRTVLFVSHNLGTIKSMCQKCAVLDQGSLVSIGRTETALEYFQRITNYQSNKIDFDVCNIEAPIYFTALEITDGKNIVNNISTDDQIIIRITMILKKISHRVALLFFIRSMKTNTRLCCFEKPINQIVPNADNKVTIEITIPENTLMPGNYSCEFGFFDSLKTAVDLKTDVGHFSIYYGKNKFSKYDKYDLGLVFIKNANINQK